MYPVLSGHYNLILLKSPYPFSPAGSYGSRPYPLQNPLPRTNLFFYLSQEKGDISPPATEPYIWFPNRFSNWQSKILPIAVPRPPQCRHIAKQKDNKLKL